MIQRMRNVVGITVHDVDLTTATNVEVTFEQEYIELNYGGENVTVVDATHINVAVPKEDAMQLNYKKPVRGQVMYTINGLPDATRVFTVSVRELLKESGYGD